MSKIIQFKNILDDPSIVVNIQKFFGVSRVISTEVEFLPDHEPLNSRRRNTTKSSLENKEKESDKPSHLLGNGGAHTENLSFEEEVGGNVSEIQETKNYVIKNKIWYFIFLFGTYLGDDVGYAIFLPFWFWNIDAKIGRKVVLVWTLIMYIGQTSKDIIRWARPPPPVIRLQKKWAEEFGMPSTHAMVGVALPSSVLYYTSRQYKFPAEYGIAFALLWCILISFSRLYLGMHSLLDVLAGLLLSSLLVIPLLPMMDYVGNTLISYDWFPLLLIVISVILIGVYPTGDTWTPTRGDTTTILATCVGIQTASWLNYVLMSTHPPPSSPSYNFAIPEWKDIGFVLLRTFLGYFGIVVSFIIFEILKKTSDWLLMKMNIKVIQPNTRRRVPFIDLMYKYLTYGVTAFHVAFTFPYVFHYLKISRSNYYWE